MRLKIAIGQLMGAHLSLPLSLEKLHAVMKMAYQEKVDLLVMGETWLSGYPAWLDHCPEVALWNHLPMKEVYYKFYQSSISILGTDFKMICEWAKSYNIMICLGINEKVEIGPGQGTIYNSVVIINSEGRLQLHHRKLIPTFSEKLLYGMGDDGRGLKSVIEPWGRVTASICWEHWMPLTRQALHDAGEQVHIALWPTVHEMHQIASRHYAFEGRCFVVAAGQMLKASDFPSDLKMPDSLKSDPDQYVLRGGSCVIDPLGNFVVPPLFNEEKLIVTEIDLEEVIKERMTLDTSGHYQRRDVFDFKIRSEKESPNAFAE